MDPNITNTLTSIAIGDAKFNIQTPIEELNGQNNVDNKDIEFNANPNMDVYYKKNDEKYYNLIERPVFPFSFFTSACLSCKCIYMICVMSIVPISILISGLFPMAVVVIYSYYMVNTKNNYDVCRFDGIGSNFQLYLFLFILNYCKQPSGEQFITLNMHRVLKKYMKVLKKHNKIIDLSMITVTCLLIFGITVLNNSCFQTNIVKNKLMYITCYLCVIYNALNVIYKIILEIMRPHSYVIYRNELETVYVQKMQNIDENESNGNEALANSGYSVVNECSVIFI